MACSGCGDLERARARRGADWAERRAAGEEEEEDGVDHFDRLPDPVVLVVLNLVGDVKALGRCCVVSRRFHALVPQVDRAVVRVDCVISDDPSAPSPSPSPDRPRGVLSHLARGLSRPLLALGQILFPSSSSPSRRSSSETSSSSPSSSEVSHHSPTEVLRNFKEIRSLRIELPAGELGVDDGVLLKWKAGFGSTLDSCVILGASPLISSPKSTNTHQERDESLGAPPADDNGGIPESFYTNGSLKLRVVWTISSLIAASARHYLLQPIIAEHETLESLELTDADGQGTLTMDRAQLQELRVRPVSASGTSQRTLVPALNMKLWYAAYLELPGGVVLKGATLVAIRPSEHPKEDVAAAGGEGCWVLNAFEEPYRTATKLLVKRRTYCLEMNSF